MSEFKNMKIEIKDEAHLKAVCDVLESMGYKKSIGCNANVKYVYVFTDGKYRCDINYQPAFDHISYTTLSDLLKMRDDMVKK